jgi:multiple sugar transport system substrate-binding protein
MTILLKGITWGHSRGFLPLVATAQRFHETHPDVRVEWSIRSLQEFADFSIVDLAQVYDLIVIDHPFTGHAAEGGILAPIDEWVSSDFLADQSENSVGPSHASYFYGGHQWALAVDAATPIAGWRPDLLERHHDSPPRTWEELLELAKRGLVVVPAIPIDSLMYFYMFCNVLGAVPLAGGQRVVDEDVGVKALEMQRELMLLCDPRCLSMNPIAVWELLAEGDTAAYCPFAYGYSNYSRAGYARNVLRTGGLIELKTNARFRSTLGGAGLAIASGCKHKELASEYARYVASPDCQATLYFNSGGQPGHSSAWRSEEVNRRSNGFFENTFATLTEAYLRPRFHGYLDFQGHAGSIVHRHLTGGDSARATVGVLNQWLVTCQRKHQGHRG